MTAKAEPVPGEATEEAITGLSQPRNGKPDDLTQIYGIDSETEKKLNALGLYHIDQIAVLTAGQRRWLFRQLGFSGRFPSWWWRWKYDAEQLMGGKTKPAPVMLASAPAEPVHPAPSRKGLRLHAMARRMI